MADMDWLGDREEIVVIYSRKTFDHGFELLLEGYSYQLDSSFIEWQLKEHGRLRRSRQCQQKVTTAHEHLKYRSGKYTECSERAGRPANVHLKYRPVTIFFSVAARYAAG
jgi:hypothetical protein